MKIRGQETGEESGVGQVMTEQGGQGPCPSQGAEEGGGLGLLVLTHYSAEDKGQIPGRTSWLCSLAIVKCVFENE